MNGITEKEREERSQNNKMNYFLIEGRSSVVRYLNLNINNSYLVYLLRDCICFKTAILENLF